MSRPREYSDDSREHESNVFEPGRPSEEREELKRLRNFVASLLRKRRDQAERRRPSGSSPGRTDRRRPSCTHSASAGRGSDELLELVRMRELRRLFRRPEINRERVPRLTKSLIAVR